MGSRDGAIAAGLAAIRAVHDRRVTDVRQAVGDDDAFGRELLQGRSFRLDEALREAESLC